jgi:hypothetical protein
MTEQGKTYQHKKYQPKTWFLFYYLALAIPLVTSVFTGCGNPETEDNENADGRGTGGCPDNGSDETADAGVWEGDYYISETTISTAACDIERLLEYKEVTGDLVVRTGESLTTIELPNLFKIGGNFIIYNISDFTSFSLPSLEEVVGDIYGDIHNPLLNPYDPSAPSEFNCPSLKTVGGSLEVSSRYGLLHNKDHGAFTLNLPLLESVSGRLWFLHVKTISLPELVSVGGDLTKMELSERGTLDLPKLVSVGAGLACQSQESVNAPLLSTVGMLYPTLGHFYIAYNAASYLPSFPSLTTVTASFKIVTDFGDNADGTGYGGVGFEFPVLASVGGDFYFYSAEHRDWLRNPMAACLVEALTDQIQAADGIGGNIDICLMSTSGDTDESYRCLEDEKCTCSEVNGVLTAECVN